MRHVPIAEFRDKASEIIAAAEAGEDIVITRHGRDVVRLIGIDRDRATRTHDSIAGLREMRERFRAEGMAVSSDEWVAWKAEGRR